MNLDHMPRPADLMDHPQLAMVVALNTTLLAAMRALLAVHTGLLERPFPRNLTEADYWADRVIYLGGLLAQSLERYRKATLNDPTLDADDF